jgi:hypothetical protein
LRRPAAPLPARRVVRAPDVGRRHRRTPIHDLPHPRLHRPYPSSPPSCDFRPRASSSVATMDVPRRMPLGQREPAAQQQSLPGLIVFILFLWFINSSSTALSASDPSDIPFVGAAAFVWGQSERAGKLMALHTAASTQTARRQRRRKAAGQTGPSSEAATRSSRPSSPATHRAGCLSVLA